MISHYCPLELIKTNASDEANCLYYNSPGKAIIAHKAIRSFRIDPLAAGSVLANALSV